MILRARMPIIWDSGRRILVWSLLVVGLIIGLVSSLRALDGLPRQQDHTEKLYLPSQLFLREVTCGFRELAADYLWFQTIQYYGAFRKGEHDLRYFRGLVDSVVNLDPRFLEGYRFGAMVLAMDLYDPTGGIEILKRGILANPDRWILPFEVGFFYYVFAQDFERASVWFDAAAVAPDASDFARRFAAFSHERAGNLEVSLALWRNLYETTTNTTMKELASRMIAKCETQLQRLSGGDWKGSL